ncbi:unnamed protein product, partial [Rotaria socialis]
NTQSKIISTQDQVTTYVNQTAKLSCIIKKSQSTTFHLSDQGYYSCILAAVQPISKLFHLRVIDNPQYLSLSLDSTFDMQREQMISSLSLIDRSVSTIF